jgi:hypothetical protein
VPATLEIVEALLQMYLQTDKLLQYSSAVKLFLSSAFDVSVLKFTSWSAAFLSTPTRITVYIYNSLHYASQTVSRFAFYHQYNLEIHHGFCPSESNPTYETMRRNRHFCLKENPLFF